MAFSRTPLLGVLVGGAGAAALVHQHRSSTAPVHRIEIPKPRDVVTFGSDGLRLLGTFHPWLRIQQAQLHEHLALHFFDGREWNFYTGAAPRMTKDAQRRMRWAQSVRPAYRGSSAGGFRYREVLGLPHALRVSVTMTKRVNDYRRLDDLTKLRVLYSMADLY